VYRVDTTNCSLEPVGDIGSRALFVGQNRSISVDTRVHNTVQPGCIYYADLSYIRAYDRNVQAWEEQLRFLPGYGSNDPEYNARPNRLDELLAAYCGRAEFAEF
jgi:hypothetical protein